MYQIGDLTQKTRCFIKIAAEEHEMRLVKEKMKWRVVVKQMNLSQTLFGHELHKSLTENKLTGKKTNSPGHWKTAERTGRFMVR